MGELDAGIYYLILLAAVVTFTGASVCPAGYDDWVYHSHTGTCLTLVNTTSTYAPANNYCANKKGGLYKTEPGHLVYIFDEDTNNFVKSLLANNRVERALIGLNDRAQNGVYKWGDLTQHIQPLGDYKPWTNQTLVPNKDTHFNSIVVTEIGWEEFNMNAGAPFICQVNGLLPKPTITCRPGEVDKTSSNITCSFDNTDALKLTELTFQRDDLKVLSCSTNPFFCDSDRYRASITGSTIKWSTLNIKKVSWQDSKSRWSCSATFKDQQSEYNLSSNECEFYVYEIPRTISCEYNYSKTSIDVSCVTDQMYPQGNCGWNINSTQVRHNKTVSYDQEFSFYKTECKVSVYRPPAAVYQITVYVQPLVPELTMAHAESVRTRTVVVPVELPASAQFYNSDKIIHQPELIVQENETAKISCKIDGGKPLVYETTLGCLEQRYVHTDGNVASRTLHFQREQHQSKCDCYGQHLSGTKGVTSLTFLVKSAPKVTNFTIDRKNDSAVVHKHSHVWLECSSTGYPQFQLSLISYQDGKHELKSVTNTYVTHQMYVTCRSMGRYGCVAGNETNKDVKHVQMNVNCVPEFCDTTNSMHRFGVAVGSNVTSFKICVYTFPRAEYFALKKDGARDFLSPDKFKASFQYTIKTFGQGEITVNVFSFGGEDIGNYSLATGRTNIWKSDLKFELFPFGPPICPENLTVLQAFSDTVTLSWKPGFNGGLLQTFTIINYNSTSAPHEYWKATQQDMNSNDDIRFNVTGLTGRTLYIFGIRTENNHSVTQCPNIKVQAVTSVPPSAPFIKALTVLSNKITIEIQAPSDNGGQPVLGYEITYFPDTEQSNPARRDVDITSDATPVELTNLRPKTNYVVKGSARNVAGKSSEVSVSITTKDMSTPLKMDITSQRYGSDPNYIFLTWAEVDDGGAPVTTFIVKYREIRVRDESAQQWQTLDDIDSKYTELSVPGPNARSFKIVGLNEDSFYDVRIIARNSQGDSPEAFQIIKTSKKETPKLYINKTEVLKSQIEVQENQTLSISCKITENTPSNYITILECFDQSNMTKQPGNVATMDIFITKESFNQTCSCHGEHMGYSTTYSSVTLLCKYKRFVFFLYA